MATDCLNRFKKRMEISGGSIRKEKLHNDRILVEKTFKDDLSYISDVYLWELNQPITDETESFGIRLFKRKFSAANGTTVQFQSLHDTPIHIGDILYLKSENEYWLCTQSFNIDDVHYKGELVLCNWMLRWQDNNNDILEYPCYSINATQYNSGETYGKNLSFASAQHQVTLPCDENTINIIVGKRFILDKNMINPATYIVTQNDTVTYNYGVKGLVKVTLMQDVFDKDKDRLDLGICDYQDKNIDDRETDDIDESIIAQIKSKSTVIKSGSKGQVFYAEFIDKENNKVDGLSPNWKIISDFTDELDIKTNGDSITIKIDNDDYIDEEFKLILTDTNDIALGDSVVIKIDSLL